MDTHFSLLPFELVEQILQCYNLQFLDVKTLHVCALVCRLWTYPAQRILFRVIHIVKELHWYGLLILLANSPHLSPLVEVLRMSVQPHYMFPEDIAMLPKLFPAVTTSYLRGVHPKTRILQNIPQLRILHVCDIPTDVPRQMWHRPTPGAPLLHHSALEEIHYAESGSFDLMEWWLSTTITHHHRTLRAATLSMRLRGTTSQAKTQRLQNFLAHYDQLEYLHLKIETYGQWDARLEGGWGSTSVRHLRLDFRLLSGRGILTYLWFILSRTDLRQLEELTVFLFATWGTTQDSVDEPGSFLLDDAQALSNNPHASNENVMRSLELPLRLTRQLKTVIVAIEDTRIDFPPSLMSIFGDAYKRGAVAVHRPARNLMGW